MPSYVHPIHGVSILITPTTLFQATITGTEIQRLRFFNTSGSTMTYTVYRVPTGGTPNTANTIIYQESIQDKERQLWDEKFAMNAGDSIVVTPSALGLVAFGDYLEVPTGR